MPRYELKGFFGNVIFICGVLYEDGIVKIYYGAVDTCIAYAEAGIGDIMDSLEKQPVVEKFPGEDID